MLNVMGAGKFERQCKALFLDNLHSIGNVNVSDLVSGFKDKDAAASALLFKSLSNFIKETDFDAFYQFHVDCIKASFEIADGKSNPVNVNLVQRPYNYQIFFWFVGCQLGPFMPWLNPITEMFKQEMTLSNNEEASSQE